MDLQVIKYKIIEFITTQKILSVLIVIIALMVSATLVIPGRKKQNLNNTYTIDKAVKTDDNKLPASSPSPQIETQNKKNTTFNPLTFFFGSNNKKNTQTNTPTSITQNTPTPRTYFNTNLPTIGMTGQSGSNNNQNSNSGTNTQNIQQNNTPSNDIPQTSIQIVFQGDDGQLQYYTPPEIPPETIEWYRYTDTENAFSIDYPLGWQSITTIYNGHNGISLYMPGDDPSNENTRAIGFIGWNVNYLSSASTYAVNIALNGIPGILYTNGPIGLSSISVVFDRTNRYFALGSSSSDETFLYIFDHMLRSISFN